MQGKIPLRSVARTNLVESHVDRWPSSADQLMIEHTDGQEIRRAREVAVLQRSI